MPASSVLRPEFDAAGGWDSGGSQPVEMTAEQLAAMPDEQFVAVQAAGQGGVPGGGQVAQEAQGQTQGQVASDPFADELGKTSQPAPAPVRPGRQQDGTFRSASRNEFDLMSEDERKSYLEQYDEAREQDKKDKAASGQPTQKVEAVPPATRADQPTVKTGPWKPPTGIPKGASPSIAKRYTDQVEQLQRDYGLGTDKPNWDGVLGVLKEELFKNPEQKKRRQGSQLKAIADAWEEGTQQTLPDWVRPQIDKLLGTESQQAASAPTQPQQPTPPQGGPVPQPTDPQPVTPGDGPKPMPFEDPQGMAVSTDALVKGNPDYYLPALDSILKREMAALAKTTGGPNYIDRVRKIANLMAVYENNANGPYAGRADFEGMAGGYLQQPKPPEPPTAQQELEAAIPGLAPVPVGKPIPVAMPVPKKPRINKKPGGTPAAKSAPSPDQPVKAGGPVPIDSVVRMAGNPQSEQNLNLILAKRGPVKPGQAKSMLSDLAAAVRGGASEVTRRIGDRTYRLYYDRDPKTGKPQLKFKEDIVPLVAGEPAATADTGEVVPLVDAAKSNTPTGGGAATLGRRIRTTKLGSAASPRPAPTVPESPAASPVPGAAIRFPVKAGKPVEPTEPGQGPADSVREAVERAAPAMRQQLADRGMVDEAKVGAIIESAAQAVDYALNNSQPSGSKPSRTYVDLGEGDDTVKAVLDVFPTANGRQRYVLRLLPSGQQSPAQSAPAAMDPGSTVIRPTTASGESSLGSGPVSSPTTSGSTLMPAGGIVIRNSSSEPQDASSEFTPSETPTPSTGSFRVASVPTLAPKQTPQQVGGPMPDPVYALDQNLWRLDINTPKDVAAAKGVIDEAADFIRSSQGTGEQTILVGNQPVKVFVDRKGVQLQFPDGDKVPYSPAQSPMSGGRSKVEEVPGQPSVSPDRPSDAEPSTKPWFTPGTAPLPKGFRVLPTPQPTTTPESPIPTTQAAAGQKASPIVIRSFRTSPSPPSPVQSVVETQPPVAPEPPAPAVATPADESKYVSDLQKFKRNNYQFPMAMPKDGGVSPALWQEFDALRKGPMRREFERGDPASRESLFKKLWDMDGGKYRPLLVPPAVKKPTKVGGSAPASIRVTAPGVASPPPRPTATSAPPKVAKPSTPFEELREAAKRGQIPTDSTAFAEWKDEWLASKKAELEAMTDAELEEYIAGQSTKEMPGFDTPEGKLRAISGVKTAAELEAMSDTQLEKYGGKKVTANNRHKLIAELSQDLPVADSPKRERVTRKNRQAKIAELTEALADAADQIPESRQIQSEKARRAVQSQVESVAAARALLASGKRPTTPEEVAAEDAAIALVQEDDRRREQKELSDAEAERAEASRTLADAERLADQLRMRAAGRLHEQLRRMFGHEDEDGPPVQLSVTIPRRRPLAFTVRSKLLGV